MIVLVFLICFLKEKEFFPTYIKKNLFFNLTVNEANLRSKSKLMKTNEKYFLLNLLRSTIFS